MEEGLVALALHALAPPLAGASGRFGAAPCTALGRLLIGATELHLAEDALTLHLFLQDAQRLIDIVFADENLHFDRFLPSSSAPERSPGPKFCGRGGITGPPPWEAPAGGL